MKKVSLSEVKDDFSRYLRVAEGEEVVITRHGRPAGVLIGFHSEDEWFDYRLESDPRFLNRIDQARQSIGKGKGIPLENLARKLPANSTQQPPRRRREPVFVGTRVPIRNLLDYLEGGDSLEEFLANFPSVSREQAVAFLEEADRAKSSRIFGLLQKRS